MAVDVNAFSSSRALKWLCSAFDRGRARFDASRTDGARFAAATTDP
jgi:hypothetical protein